METNQGNVSGVNRGIVSIGSAGSITNNVGQQQPRELPVADLRALLAELAPKLPDAVADPAAKAEIGAELQTVQAQLASPRPKPAIIRESLRTIRSIVESIAGNVGARLLDAMEALLP